MHAKKHMNKYWNHQYLTQYQSILWHSTYLFIHHICLSGCCDSLLHSFTKQMHFHMPVSFGMPQNIHFVWNIWKTEPKQWNLAHSYEIWWRMIILRPSNRTSTEKSHNGRCSKLKIQTKSKRLKHVNVINQSLHCFNGSIMLHVSTHYISPILTNHLIFEKPSIFIIHILIPCISTRQWYLWPNLLELWSILVRHVTSQDHNMSTRHIEASARCREVTEVEISWEPTTKIQRDDMNIYETWSGLQTRKLKWDNNF